MCRPRVDLITGDRRAGPPDATVRPYPCCLALDETYVKVNGVGRYVYRAVDQYGQVIDISWSQFAGTPTRPAGSSKRPWHVEVTPDEVVTDGSPVYPRVLDEVVHEVVPAAWHYVERCANNQIEADHSRLNSGCGRCAAYVPTYCDRRPLSDGEEAFTQPNPSRQMRTHAEAKCTNVGRMTLGLIALWRRRRTNRTRSTTIQNDEAAPATHGPHNELPRRPWQSRPIVWTPGFPPAIDG